MKFKAPIVEAEAEVQVAEDELKAAKAKALRPAMGANIFIDGRFVGQNPQMGCAIGVGQKTVRAELLEAGQVTMVAISNVNVAADTIQEVSLSLEKQKGGLLVINSVQAEVRLDERELDFKKLDAMQVSVGSRKIEAKKWVEVKRRDGSKEWQLFSGKDDIEICRDHVLKVRISEGTNKLNFERLNELGSCRGIWPRATHENCPAGGPANLHYFQTCALGVPWGTTEGEMQQLFGTARKHQGWLVYEHPEKGYRLAYRIGPRGKVDGVKATGTGAPMVSDLISGMATHGEVVREVGNTADVTGVVTGLMLHQEPNGCAKSVRFRVRDTSFLVLCRPEHAPQEWDDHGHPICTSTLLCSDWRVAKR